MHPLNGAIPGLVPVRITRIAMVAHWYTYAPPHSTAGQLFLSIPVERSC